MGRAQARQGTGSIKYHRWAAILKLKQLLSTVAAAISQLGIPLGKVAVCESPTLTPLAEAPSVTPAMARRWRLVLARNNSPSFP